MLQRKDVDIIASVQEFHFPDSERFTADNDQFFVAAALTNYDSNRAVTESKEYGELLIEQYGWGNEEYGYSYGSHPVENHFCTDADLGITRSEKTRIFPIFERSQAEVDTYRNKFKCIDPDELQIWGDYNSAQAMQYAVNFHMCQGESYCKSK